MKVAELAILDQGSRLHCPQRDGPLGDFVLGDEYHELFGIRDAEL